MKLIIQIPCFNEAQSLPQTIQDLPKTIEGIDCIETLIIDDGSSDNTIGVARQLGVDHIISNKHNIGLAKSFHRGIDQCLQRGADIIVNTDGDNQYQGADIKRLVVPILNKQADIVIGDRETHKIAHFSRIKKMLQWLGSSVVRRLSGIEVSDTVSGFRAISKEAAIKLNILSSYSYTVEMIIQAGKRGIKVVSVPVGTNPVTRESRLFKNIPDFVIKQLGTIIRMYVMYKPLRAFFYLGSILFLIGILPITRFLYMYFTGNGDGHIQSLVLGGVLLLMSGIAGLAGLLADIISYNRQLHEMTLEKVRRVELSFSRNDEGL
ncbi:MAG: glycosyltransferase family 2 protein [Gammaproteobacteria bacterium]|nr:glycosyltransferase family 2 protein [Gammaproteobacteria bacterium]